MSVYKIPELKPGMRVHFTQPNTSQDIIGIVSHENYKLPAENRGLEVLLWIIPGPNVNKDSYSFCPSADMTTSTKWVAEHSECVNWVTEAPPLTLSLYNPKCSGEYIYVKPKTRRMTMDQLCEALGYLVEIIPSPEGDS